MFASGSQVTNIEARSCLHSADIVWACVLMGVGSDGGADKTLEHMLHSAPHNPMQ